MPRYAITEKAGPFVAAHRNTDSDAIKSNIATKKTGRPARSAR